MTTKTDCGSENFYFPITTPTAKIFIFRLQFQLRKTLKLSIENERHLKYFTIEKLEAIIHKKMNWLTDENRPKVIEVILNFFICSIKQKTEKWMKKFDKKRTWKTDRRTSWVVDICTEEKTSKSSDKHFTHISLFNFSKNLCNTRCLVVFFINMNNKVTYVWNSRTLSRGWAFNRHSDSDSNSVGVDFRGPPRVCTWRSLFFMTVSWPGNVSSQFISSNGFSCISGMLYHEIGSWGYKAILHLENTGKPHILSDFYLDFYLPLLFSTNCNVRIEVFFTKILLMNTSI